MKTIKNTAKYALKVGAAGILGTVAGYCVTAYQCVHLPPLRIYTERTETLEDGSTLRVREEVENHWTEGIFYSLRTLDFMKEKLPVNIAIGAATTGLAALIPRKRVLSR